MCYARGHTNLPSLYFPAFQCQPRSPSGSAAASSVVDTRQASASYQEALSALQSFSYNHGMAFTDIVQDADDGGSKSATVNVTSPKQSPLQASPIKAPHASSSPSSSSARSRTRSSSVPVIDVSKAWTEHFDANHGVPYYHNRVTGETTWEPPEGFQSI